MENQEWDLNMTKDEEGFVHVSAIDYDLALKDIYAQVGDLTP